MPGTGLIISLGALGGAATLAYRRGGHEVASTASGGTVEDEFDIDVPVSIDERLEAYDGETLDDPEELNYRLREIHQEVMEEEYDPSDYGLDPELLEE